MATITQRITDLATATGQKLKALNLLVAGVATGSLAGLTTTDKTSIAAAINEINAALGVLQSADYGQIDDAATTGTDVTWSVSKINVELAAYRDALLGGAGAAYDTLAELQALLEGDATELADLLTAVGKRVRFDAAQTLTTGEQLQARNNIAAQSEAAIGFADDNFVTVLNTAMT